MKTMTLDGNGAAAYISYAFSELAIIYPITPSSPMAELADEWQAQGKTNLFGQVPKVVQMQSEGGVAGALHGALSCGALATTYTCSQGLLLMLPNMYKIAGELLPTVFHVSARALATHALSILGDHQDVMAVRQSGFAMLASGTVQEVGDLSLVAHLATLETGLPFLHFFDGFRTSHEMMKIHLPTYEEMKSLINEEALQTFRKRALTPTSPVCQGTTQSSDLYFQNRERANPYYQKAPSIVQSVMDRVAKITKRAYHVFDYVGSEQAERVVVLMGSGASAMEETIEKCNQNGEAVGMIKVRLYRPFSATLFTEALPKTCRRIAVLDRTKEAGCLGEPLYLDICAAVQEKHLPIEVMGGRYGIGQKEFTPSMCFAVLENLKNAHPKNHFTVGIVDDLTDSSLNISTPFEIDAPSTTACKFYGLGSDGTVGANKNSIQLIGEHTPLYVQGYFCYDSKKSGGTTISHLRFGATPIRSSYLITHPDFVACHDPSYLKRYDILEGIKPNGTLLLNCPYTNIEELNAYLPPSLKQTISQKSLKLYVLDATTLARDVGLKGRTGVIMQAAFFYLNPNILPFEQAKSLLKDALKRKFAKKGDDVVNANCKAVDGMENALVQIQPPSEWLNLELPIEEKKSGSYFHDFIQPVLRLKGDDLPTSAFSPDGRVPTGTSQLEKHGAPALLPKWRAEYCIQCNRCSFVCPHATIRPYLIDEENPDFPTIPAVGMKNRHFRIQVSPYDCKGCGLCANICPPKEKALVMTPSANLSEEEAPRWEWAQTLPQTPSTPWKRTTLKGSQFYPPLFEFSYACAGCGETPYIKILTQLFGEKLLLANATGCSSIYGGSAPTCPYTVNDRGHGPVFANSLFEDNAEFGLGMRLAQEVRKEENTSVWIVGGDGWAYDIGYGGLDHVLASGHNVNVLVLDSEVYSNTGGQTSKASPMGGVARFAVQGKSTQKKNLGLMAITYGHVYVAQVSMGADMTQLLNALSEAEAYNGPSLIIAYSPCIAHGISMERCMEEEKRAVECGYWQLYRFHPEKKSPFVLDSKPPMSSFTDFLKGENRFASLQSSNPERARELFQKAEEESRRLRRFYERLTTIFEEE
ncbi:MAG: pyruvate:ferredoxin (flavodoxin) oxidoreductase [Clostridia bacterium]|nr:pyruvate:ferredoxin (flavodoxin) oxidoreductase [Clostridia bacterium]